MISRFENKKILVLGFGEEGMDTLTFLRENASCKKIGVADALSYNEFGVGAKRQLKEDVNLHLGEDYLRAVKNYDIIIKSPGIPSSIIELKKGQEITSQSDIFLSYCRDRVIGVTGTKGKSTTCLLLHDLLLRAGYSAELVGNIGTPALSFLSKKKNNTLYVYELSSFQLETVSVSPKISVMLNIFPDHLDKHESMDAYVNSKRKITAFQKEDDLFIYNKEDARVCEIADNTKAKKIPFSPKRKMENASAYLDPVVKLMNIFGIEEKVLDEVLRNFKGLPHRIEYLGRYKGIDFYNDSAATIPEATVSAITTLKNVQTLILGGVDKGGDYKKMLEEIERKKEIRNIIIFKGTSNEIADFFENSDKLVFPASDMQEAVEHCFNNTGRGNACLLSPGFASFNMFKNYKERGELFKGYIRNYT